MLKRPRPHQVINATLIGHLRSPPQPVTLNEVRQPQLRHTDTDVKHPLIWANADAAMNPVTWPAPRTLKWPKSAPA